MYMSIKLTSCITLRVRDWHNSSVINKNSYTCSSYTNLPSIMRVLKKKKRKKNKKRAQNDPTCLSLPQDRRWNHKMTPFACQFPKIAGEITRLPPPPPPLVCQLHKGPKPTLDLKTRFLSASQVGSFWSRRAMSAPEVYPEDGSTSVKNLSSRPSAVSAVKLRL